MRAAVTVRPLPVVTSRGCGGFKRRQLLLLLHPLLGSTEDTCEAAGQSSLITGEKRKVEVKYDGRILFS